MGTLRGWISGIKSNMGADPKAGAPVPGPEGIAPSPTGGTSSDPLQNSVFTGGGNDPALPNGDLSGVIPREVTEALEGGGGQSGGDGLGAPIQLAQAPSPMSGMRIDQQYKQATGTTLQDGAPIPGQQQQVNPTLRSQPVVNPMTRPSGYQMPFDEPVMKNKTKFN